MEITADVIRAMSPCYDPSEICSTEGLSLTPLQFIEQFKDKVPEAHDIIWVLCRPQFMSVKDLRLFAVWCAREALKLVENADPRCIECCNVAENFANGDATQAELASAAAEAAQIEQLKTYFK